MVLQSLSIQSSLLEACPIEEAVEHLAGESGIGERGAIYTKREVVNFILDLVGYAVDQPLYEVSPSRTVLW